VAKETPQQIAGGGTGDKKGKNLKKRNSSILTKGSGPDKQEWGLKKGRLKQAAGRERKASGLEKALGKGHGWAHK